ncbi:M15 family metallopeptidase [Mycobacterium sp. CVI_P3]|uniref:M15 family metallopeptidase n=1 Tax=Mycobacterium pinniadriaticum TaxID=2994102 RepID=A0ABT3SEA2_9MYCO|nr:M15 family metallopeptidase [Mycobacterium pinniadriaticum]MCX2931424.1 M15 family metallopeptidase [Mycobacterium pinniadriaticum]MCX2937848.1 M15 family metallopeptidase [Mycobacterium pinniadriaticum]
MTWYTENGWPACGPDELDRSPIPGTNIVVPLQRGIPNTILKAFLAAINQFVESAYNSRGGSDEGGWTGTNSVPTSNHLGGTATDYNWSDHPMGVALAGWHGSDLVPGEQEPAVRDVLKFFTYKGIQLVWWGNDWNSPKDSMHFQMGYGTYEHQDICLEFIAKFILPSGFSTYRPSGGGVVTTPVTGSALSILMRAIAPTSVDEARVAALLPGVVRCFDEGAISTVPRRAMWFAQVGHESAGFRYQEEVASGAAYEGRIDLGNIRPGDGVRFKGRDFIQITGRHNYSELSSWAFAKGLVPTPTFFVDNPGALATDEYAFVGTTWYWTTQRRMNDASDARDIELATRYINGGLNGLADRKARYATANSLGELLLAIATETDSEEELMATLTTLKVKSLSIYATPGEDDVLLINMLRAIDAHGNHEDYVEKQARLGDADALFRVARTAAGRGIFGDAPFAVNQACAVLAAIKGITVAEIKEQLKGQAA